MSKLGIRNLSPHLRNSAILRTTKLIAELQTKKSCGTAIADLQNLTSAILQLYAVSCQFRYFLVPFPQLRIVLKINKGEQHNILTSDFFFMNRPESWFIPKILCSCPFKILNIAKNNIYIILFLKLLHGQNMPKIAEVKVSSCGLEVADSKKSCTCPLLLIVPLYICTLNCTHFLHLHIVCGYMHIYRKI